MRNFRFWQESGQIRIVFFSVQDTNFWASVNMTHHALPHLKSSKGQIYVTASVSSIAPVPMNSLYNVSLLQPTINLP
jgi:hypothetical protein